MAHSESLAQRVRDLLGPRQNIVERKMFGGIGFLLHGNMLVGVWKTSLIARVGAEAYDVALKRSHVSEFDVTGRPMKGWVMIGTEGVESNLQLEEWVTSSHQFVSTLPRKQR
ncbi:TfoX/Sxy family protein [bacterium]|nr:TfoX/Sxy family protein [bacterium]